MEDNKKILVVDDEKSLARALQLKLTSEGYNVDTAFDGKEALQALQETKYDLVLLDLVMPNVNGYVVLEKMKKTNPNLKIVVTSNLSQDEDKLRVQKLGAIKYFVKSNSTLSEIVNYIKETL